MSDSPDRIRNRADYRRFLAADLRAHGRSGYTFLTGLRHPQLRFQRALRRAEFLNARTDVPGRVLALVARFLLLRQSVRTGLSVPPGVFGPGLSLAHYGSVVVNDKARVGARCRLHSATNIGTAGTAGAPTIGDDVYIGPGAVIYGPVTIGDGVVIGANAVVNKDVPSGVTVAGAPARIISERDSSSIMPRWMLADRELTGSREV